MAIRTFNSVGGFSVGENPETIILANGDITTDFATFTGNVDAGNVKTDNLLKANGTPWVFVTPGGSNTQIQFNDNGSLGGTSALTFDKSSNVVTVSGNASIGNLSVTGNAAIAGNATVSGNVTAPFFIGNVVGNISGNLTIPGSNTDIVFNKQGVAGTSDAFRFNYSSNTLTVVGDIVGNTVTGSLVTAAQPNITSVGTLTSLVVSGNLDATTNINGGNLKLTDKVMSSLIPSNTDTYDLGSSSYKWRELYISNINIGSTSIKAIANVLQVDAINAGNNVSVGSLTSRGDAALQGNVTVSGNLTVSGTTTYVNATNTSIQDPLIDLGGSSSGGNVASYDGKDRGLVLHNYYSNGSGPVNQFIGWDTSNVEFALGSNVAVSGETVTFNTLGNIRLDTVQGNLNGTVVQASQTNITTLGTLTNLTIAGNLQVNTKANISSLTASGIQYPTSDGTAGQVMSTYGNGMLYFTTIDTYRIQNGTSNVTAYNNGNVAISSAGNANIAIFTGTGANVNGYLTVSGTAKVDKLVIANLSTVGSATTTTTATTKTTIATVSVTGISALEFFVKGTESAGGKYSVATVSAVSNGSAVDYAVYGTVNLGGSTGILEVNYSGGSVTLDVTPASSNSTVWTTQYRTI